MKSKNELRKEIAAEKKGYSESELQNWSETICNKIEMLPAFNDATAVLLYYHLKREVQTTSLLDKWNIEKRLFLPVVNENDLVIRKYEGRHSVSPGSMGIQEPTGNNFTSWKEIDLIIVPGIAFDKNRNRLGRGKGYYDRLLSQMSAIKVGICFDFQFFDEIPAEATDTPMDYIITPTRIISKQ